jgi:hypothetical protein
MTQRTYTDWDWEKVRALCLDEARRYLGTSTAADDAAQEAAIRAWRHQTHCRTPQNRSRGSLELLDEKRSASSPASRNCLSQRIAQ